MKTLLALTIVCLGVCFAGCSSLNKTYEIQGAAVAHFHDLFNSGKADSIWDEASARFQGSIDKPAFVAYLERVHAKLGQALSTANADRRMTTANQTTTVYLSQETRFDWARGIETFTFLLEGDRALLVSYNVQSKLLAEK